MNQKIHRELELSHIADSFEDWGNTPYTVVCKECGALVPLNYHHASTHYYFHEGLNEFHHQ